jgi:hypothetical protein
MKQKTGKILVDIDVLEFKISISPIYFVDYQDVKLNLLQEKLWIYLLFSFLKITISIFPLQGR